MIDILHSTACVIALYKIIEAALSKTQNLTISPFFWGHPVVGRVLCQVSFILL